MARVDLKQAICQAAFHLAVNRDSYGLSWKNTSVRESVLFWDIKYGKNDDPVLYVFDVVDKSNNLVKGYIGICGSDYLGSTLVFLKPSINNRSIKNLLEDCKLKFINKLGLSDSKVITPVVYSYPKIGLSTDSDSEIKYIIDIFSGESFDLPVVYDDNTQGLIAWSFWDEYPQASNSQERWSLENDFINQILVNNSSDDIDAITEDYDSYIYSKPPIVDLIVIPVNLIGQINSVYCAPTSLQMIYKHVYGTTLDPEDIAQSMNITPSGSTLSGQKKAFDKYFGEDFEIKLDRTPSYADIKESIEQNHLPMKSGIRGHARTAIGVRREMFINPLTDKILLEKQFLLINDPEPVGKGSLKWEDISTIGLRDFIVLLRR